MNEYMKVIINAIKHWTNDRISTVDKALKNKVDAVDGKGLSTEDFTTAHKNKLESIDVNSQISKHNTSTAAHSDIRKSINDLSTLVGNTPVSDQIADAIDNIELPEINYPVTSVNGQTGNVIIPNELPEVTADNDGNVLKVVDGAWTTGDIPNELPEVTADNDGNVLKVVDGAWTTGEIPEGFSGSWNDLTDRPFYEDVDPTAIVDGVFALEGMNSNQDGTIYGPPYGSIFNPNLKLESGATYKVVIDGKEYTMIAKSITQSENIEDLYYEYTLVYLGNIAIYMNASNPTMDYEDTGEEFCICYINITSNVESIGNEESSAFITNTQADSVSIRINKIIIRTINNRYLPEALRFGDKLEPEQITIVDNMELTLEFENNSYGASINTNAYVLEAGHTYKVIFNGEERIGTAKIYNEGDYHIIYIGNFRLGEEGYIGDDFLVAYAYMDGDEYGMYNVFMFGTTIQYETVSISLYEIIDRFTTIDKKYLPKDVVTEDKFFTLIPSPDWNQADENATDYIKNRTHYIDRSNQTFIEWDGSIDGRDVIVSDDYSSFYKVSSVIPAESALAQNICITTTYIPNSESILTDFAPYGVYDGAILISNGISVILIVKSLTFNIEGEQFNAPSTGVYFSKMDLAGTPFTYVSSFGYGRVKIQKLNEAFIPDTIARANNIMQSDWNQTDENAIDYIKNKPSAHDSIVLIDQSTGFDYNVFINNGDLVVLPKCTKIEVTSLPTSTDYELGSELDITGMVVMGTFSDGSTSEINDYTLTVHGNTATVTYIEFNNTYSDTFSVNMNVTDFAYTLNSDGSVVLDTWKGTLNGEPSTECVIPNGGDTTVII